MNPASNGLFGSDLWQRALESFSSAAHLTVKLFDANERLVFGPVHPTPIHLLFAERGYEPGMVGECVRQCLAQKDNRPAVVVSEFYGLSVVGTSLVLDGRIVGAAVGGYAFLDFSQASEVERLARDAGISFEQLWRVAREQKPVPKHRLLLNGELLQVLGDAMLRENERSRQLRVAVSDLEEAAKATDNAHRELRAQEARLRRTEKMAAAGQLAASMSHEINNPLSSVTNALYLLENHRGLDKTARMYVGTAATELARVTRIVRQSLSYYRVGTAPRDLDLGGIVNESLQIFKEKIRQAGITLKPKIQKGTVVLGFPDELRQVIDNLLLNSLAATPAGGTVGVSVYQSHEWAQHDGRRLGVRLTIADTGYGIPLEVRKRIFEPFFTTKAEKGNGLGLWVLQGIVSKHDGVLSVRSSDTKGRSGTVMSLFLPSHARTPRKSKAPKKESAA